MSEQGPYRQVFDVCRSTQVVCLQEQCSYEFAHCGQQPDAHAGLRQEQR